MRNSQFKNSKKLIKNIMTRTILLFTSVLTFLFTIQTYSQTNISVALVNDSVTPVVTNRTKHIVSKRTIGLKARDTVFTNLKSINSISDDYIPFFVDSILLFTSNRKTAQEAQSTENTEKVYMSKNEKGKWNNPTKDYHLWENDNISALIGVSAENYYLYKTDINDNGDIFSVKRKPDTKNTGKRQQLKKLRNISTEFDENSIAIGKGDTVYFVSDRNEDYDIYQQVGGNAAKKVDSINTQYDEVDVFLTENAQTMFFSSNRPGGKGGFDIYETVKIGKVWSSPILVDFPNVNSSANDRDFRQYGDSTMFFTSNRNGGQGGMDIYVITLRTPKNSIVLPPIDTVKKNESEIVCETIKVSDSAIVSLISTTILKQTDTIQNEHDDLFDKLNELGLSPFRGEVQLGAFRFITSIEKFKRIYTCLKHVDLRMDKVESDGLTLYKFIVNKLYTDVDEALNMRLEMINKHCLPHKSFDDMPFIAMFDKNNNRYALFCKKNIFLNKNIYYIFQNGKQIWKGKRL
jgi:hypothetical protein